jgi:hypothetical protein
VLSDHQKRVATSPNACQIGRKITVDQSELATPHSTLLLVREHGPCGSIWLLAEASVANADPLAKRAEMLLDAHDRRCVRRQGRLIDEAQLRGRRVRIWQEEPTGDIRLGLGLNPDGAPKLELASGNAFALLASLGLEEESCGTIPMSQLWQRLMDPRIRQRLDEDPHMSRYVEALTTMAALKPTEGEYHLAWT